MWKIPLFDVQFDTSEMEAALAVMRKGWLTMGEEIERFEKKFANLIGSRHAIAVSSGTAALHLGHLALGVRSGDEVICPSLTFVAGANSVLYVGAKPVFADIESLDDLTISPADIARKISPATRAIQVVHYAGHPCDMDPIMEIARNRGLAVIEDCAHAPGARYRGKQCGAIGDLGCFSFFSNKNMTTAEGGMVTTDSDELARRIRLMRSHGMTASTLDRHRGITSNYDVTALGYNYRLDEVRAAIGLAQLEKLPLYNAARARLTRLYRDLLHGMEGITMPFQNTPSGRLEGAHHILPIVLDRGVNRNEFTGWMKSRGIQTSNHYPPIHLFEYYRNTLGYRNQDLPNTEEAGGRQVTLPLYPTMTVEQVGYVAENIRQFLTASSRSWTWLQQQQATAL